MVENLDQKDAPSSVGTGVQWALTASYYYRFIATVGRGAQILVKWSFLPPPFLASKTCHSYCIHRDPNDGHICQKSSVAWSWLVSSHYLSVVFNITIKCHQHIQTIL